VYRPIQPLPQEVARKIAAGEVIDRPAAIVRELLDNAIDAGASSVILELDEGGIGRIRVVDNGCGMTREDLECCAHPHTTSKISTEDDLFSLSTLGFRGEALSSISAVSRMEIISVRKGGTPWKRETRPAAEFRHGTELCPPQGPPAANHGPRISPATLAEGTVVQVSALFENFPARRVFLKRPASEGQLCRQTFIEKALPWPQIAFRLVMDGKQKLNLRGGQSLKERYLAAMEHHEPDIFFHEQKHEQEGFSFTLILGQPEVSRSDRKHIYIFINGRRIWEYALVQAIEYGAQGYFPNGTHPVACLFLQVNPSLIDFNIHPAKKEVRFRDMGPVHRSVSSTVREFYRSLSVAALVRDTTELRGAAPQRGAELPGIMENRDGESLGNYGFISPVSRPGRSGYGESYTGEKRVPYGKNQGDRARTFPDGRGYTPGISPSEAYERLTSGADTGPDVSQVLPKEREIPFRYLGQIMGVFLIAESEGTLYLIDQHAAHERILFDRIMENQGTRQELLIPYIIETESEEDERYLDSRREELEAAGFSVSSRGDGSWEISSVPQNWSGTEEELAADILKNRRISKDLIYDIAASAACRAAVKDGDFLDDATARELAEQTFALSDPHCPHGRPIWAVITREQMFALVKRS
jgi:DNA mismatch repair protein MutL